MASSDEDAQMVDLDLNYESAEAFESLSEFTKGYLTWRVSKLFSKEYRQQMTTVLSSDSEHPIHVLTQSPDQSHVVVWNETEDTMFVKALGHLRHPSGDLMNTKEITDHLLAHEFAEVMAPGNAEGDEVLRALQVCVLEAAEDVLVQTLSSSGTADIDQCERSEIEQWMDWNQALESDVVPAMISMMLSDITQITGRT